MLNEVIITAVLVILSSCLSYLLGKSKTKAKSYEQIEKQIIEARKAINSLNNYDARTSLRNKYFRD